MKKTRHPISFIATDSPTAAEVFYGKVMGLRLLEASPFALVFADGDQVLRVDFEAGRAVRRLDRLGLDALRGKGGLDSFRCTHEASSLPSAACGSPLCGVAA